MELVAALVVIVSILALLPCVLFQGKDAPFIPVGVEVVERVMNVAGVGPGDVFFDLGSGDGRLVIAAAARGARAYGVEINWLRVWYSRILVYVFGLSSTATIIYGDLLKTDLESASVVYFYLLPIVSEKVKEKLLREAKREVRIVALASPLAGLELVKEELIGPIRLYRLPRSIGS